MRKILIVDDDKNISQIIKLYSLKNDFIPVEANNSDETFRELRLNKIDIVILDVMLPGLNGFEILKLIREKYNNIPVVMLTAKNEIFDKIQGFSQGADDYVSKPFEPRELMARVKAVLRRSGKEQSDGSGGESTKTVILPNLFIDLNSYTLKAKGKKVNLKTREMHLLFFLASHQNIVFKREDLLERIWGIDCYTDIRTVDVHVNRIREKIKDASCKWRLKTVWGVGYKFEVD